MARKTKVTTEAVELTQNNIQPPESAGEQEHDTHYRSRCGGALRTARESQGLSIQEIASRLRLSVKQIEAVEADNFAALPEPTIVRGFIRNYAKQLKISAEPLLDAYNVIVPSDNPHDLIVKPSANMKMTSYKKPNTARNFLLGILALAGLGTWLFYRNYVEKPSPVAPSASVELPLETLPEVALPAAERATELQAATELTLPPASTTASMPTDTTATAAAPAVAPPALPVAPTEPTVLPPSNTTRLEFNATQETWVSVVDATGKEVFSNTIFAGSRENIEVTLPVNITVGNAGATSLSMNGKPVELAPHSRNNVAHVKLE